MWADAGISWAVSSLVLGLRIAPVFAFAPPFSLTRIPRLALLLLGLGLSACLVSTYPQTGRLPDIGLYTIVAAAAREAALGTMFVLAFQIVFGALYLAGRTVDLQAGFGFALLVDPKSQAQMPLVGTLFAYAAGAAFFSMDGHLSLLRVLAASLEAIPLGSWTMPLSISRITAFISVTFMLAMGVGAATMLVMFIADMVIALLSRTVPQMNVLVLGFQIKTVLLFLVLPLSFGLAGSLFLRLMILALEALPRMI